MFIGVWEGVHYRFSDEVAAKVGQQVAAWDLPRLAVLKLRTRFTGRTL